MKNQISATKLRADRESHPRERECVQAEIDRDRYARETEAESERVEQKMKKDRRFHCSKKKKTCFASRRKGKNEL